MLRDVVDAATETLRDRKRHDRRFKCYILPWCLMQRVAIMLPPGHRSGSTSSLAPMTTTAAVATINQ